VDVLNSPSHADDKVEAKKQAKELGEMKGETGEHDHLLADMPGAKFKRGKGMIAGHFGVEVDGSVVGNYHAKPEDAVAEAKQSLAGRAAHAKEKAERADAMNKLRDRLVAGGEATDADLKLLGLKDGSSGLKWFIPAAAQLFGITSHAVRPRIKDLIRVGHSDMGTKLEFVDPKKALRAIAAGLNPAKPEDTQALKDKLEILHDFLSTKPDSPNAPAWKEKIAEIEAKIGPLQTSKPAAAKAEVDTSSWGEPAKAAHALSVEYRSLDKLNNKAVGAFKIKLRALAKKTPEDDAHATLILDGLVTKLWGTDYDPKVADVQFAAAKPAQAPADAQKPVVFLRQPEPGASNLSNNAPMETKKEQKMENLARARKLAGGAFDDLPDDDVVASLDYAERTMQRPLKDSEAGFFRGFLVKRREYLAQQAGKPQEKFHSDMYGAPKGYAAAEDRAYRAQHHLESHE